MSGELLGESPRPVGRMRVDAAVLMITGLGLALRDSVADVLAGVRADTHPPLYFLLLHFWIRLFGESDLALRSLSALFGVLALPVIFAAAARLAGRRVGVLAALFSALSPWQI